jgi:hypothetical protein
LIELILIELSRVEVLVLHQESGHCPGPGIAPGSSVERRSRPGDRSHNLNQTALSGASKENIFVEKDVRHDRSQKELENGEG